MRPWETNPIYLLFPAGRQGLTRMFVAADCHNMAHINHFAASWQGLLVLRLKPWLQALRMRRGSESPPKSRHPVESRAFRDRYGLSRWGYIND
jgi:hypothetical protein